MTAHRAFLSYASSDKPFAMSFGRELERQGIFVVDGRDIEPGEVWAAALRESIEQADAVVLILPETGHDGANAAFFEAGAAFQLGKLVFAVVPNNDRSRLDNLPSSLIRLAIFNPGDRPGLSADVTARELKAMSQQAA